MGSRRVFASLARHKWLILTGVVAGALLMMVSLYTISFERDDAGRVTGMPVDPRSFAVYESKVNLVIDIPGFGIGRSDVGVARGIELAPTYAFLAMSEPVRVRAESKVGPIEETVLVGAVDRSPVVRITVQAETPERAEMIANSLGDAFIDYLTDYQNSNAVPQDKRVIVRTLGAAAPPAELQSRGLEIALIMLLAPILAAGALALWLERPEDAT